MTITTEQTPGYCWRVSYQWESGLKDTMIASAVKIEDAVKEARYSLDLADTPYNILSAERVD